MDGNMHQSDDQNGPPGFMLQLLTKSTQQEAEEARLLSIDPSHQHHQASNRDVANNKTSWTKDKRIMYSVPHRKSKMPPLLTDFRNIKEQQPTKQPTTIDPNKRDSESINGVGANDAAIGQVGELALSTSQVVQRAPSSPNIIGHYELKKTLGKGNFSTVKLAQHRITKHLVAIKIIKTSTLSEDNLLKINREINILKSLDKHDNIVRLYQVIKLKRYYMLVTEHCANGELYDYIVDKGKLSEPKACQYFAQILSAVEYLHSNNIVHRDLKAENLLLSNDSKTIKIADFGFANTFEGQNPLTTCCGSPPYAAPELFNGAKYCGPPVDIWSLGVILYALVCGSLPFDGCDLAQLKCRVLSGKYRIPYFMSTECESLLREMLRLNPVRRFNVPQIWSHEWMLKFSGRRCNETPVSLMSYESDGELNDSGFPECKSLAPLFKKNKDTIIKDSGIQHHEPSNGSPFQEVSGVVDSASIASGDGSTNRGASLDLEDQSSKLTDSASETTMTPEATVALDQNDGDASMLCLSQDDKTTTLAKDKQPMTALASRDAFKMMKMKNLIDNDIANDVSNMSLDSNLSNSHSIETTSRSISIASSKTISTLRDVSGQNSGGDSATAGLNLHQAKLQQHQQHLMKKDGSIDDQILDFMVDTIRVAQSHSPIKHSIGRGKFDDLHAIYRLLKDKPDIIYSGQCQAILPLIGSKKLTARKPSITSGFFNAPPPLSSTNHNFNNNNNTNNNNIKDNVARQGETPSQFSGRQPIDNSMLTGQSAGAGDSQNATSSAHMEADGAGSSSCSSWQMPPELFLTPPTGAGNQVRLASQPLESQLASLEQLAATSRSTTCPQFYQQDDEMRTEDIALAPMDTPLEQDNLSGNSLPRHSLDSRMHQLFESPSSGLSTAAIDPNLWDSSILDSIAASLSPSSSLALNNQANDGNRSAQDKLILGLDQRQRTHLSQQQQPIDTNQAFALQMQQSEYLFLQQSCQQATGQTRSSLFVKGSPDLKAREVPLAEFMPNNLLNQNYNNYLACTSNLDAVAAATAAAAAASNGLTLPNYTLLDPNGLCSGLERRASDGQASYRSLISSDMTSSIGQQQQQQVQTGAGGLHFEPLAPSLSSSSSLNRYKPLRCHKDDYSVEAAQTNPLDLSVHGKQDGGSGSLISETDSIREASGGGGMHLSDRQLGKIVNRRSHSTTSSSLIFQMPGTPTSPNSSMGYCHGSTRASNLKSLKGGTPGYQLTGRKRHSLESELRHYHNQQARNHGPKYTGNQNQQHSILSAISTYGYTNHTSSSSSERAWFVKLTSHKQSELATKGSQQQQHQQQPRQEQPFNLGNIMASFGSEKLTKELEELTKTPRS